MITANDVDWSKAPEDAEFYCTDNFMWYKVRHHSLYMSLRVGDDWDESCLNVEEMRNDSSFIPRPVQQTNQQTVKVSVQMNKPPIGLMPKNIWLEWTQAQRQKDIKEAMLQYIEAGKDIPNEWLQELIELNNVIQNVQPEATVDKSEPVWIENTQAKDYHPPTLDPQTYIEVVSRDGDTDVGLAADWECCWNTAYNSSQDIVRYRILGGDE